MNLKSANKILARLEGEFDVWRWQFQGMRYWPLLRLYLWKLLIADISAPVGQNNVSRGLTKVKSASAVAKPKTAARLKFSVVELKQRAQENFFNAENVDVLLLARIEDCVDLVAGKLHDRIIDPVYRLLSDCGKPVAKVISYRGEEADTSNFAVNAPVYSADSFGEIDCISPDISEITALFERVNALGKLSLVPNDPVFRSLLVRSIQRGVVFDAILDAYRPKAVFLGVYYDAFQMAVIRACKMRGIKVVDIQHGKQGRYHGAYTDWKNIPLGGSEFLPDNFWVWGEQTAKRIRAGMGAQSKFHSPIVGGNQWLAEWKDNLHPQTELAKKFIEEQSNFTKRVLVSLQPIEEPICKTLLEALNFAPPQWVFWFRLHNKQKAEIDKFAKQVGETGAKFEMALPSELPLYSLIDAADYHITEWSSVAFEAEALGVPTSLVAPISKTILASEIAEKRFRYASSAKELLVQIQNKEHKTLREILPGPLRDLFRLKPYIIADRALARKKIVGLLK